MTAMYGQNWQDLEQRVSETNIFGGRSLREKMMQDCKVVFAAGTTFDELADHVENLSSILESKSNSVCGDPKWVSFPYNPANSLTSTLGKCSQTGSFKGRMSPCLAYEFSRRNIFHQKSYSYAWRIENLANHIELVFSKQGLTYLRNGFIDGIDAASLIALVTGDSVESIRNITGIEKSDMSAETTKSLYDTGASIPKDLTETS